MFSLYRVTLTGSVSKLSYTSVILVGLGVKVDGTITVTCQLCEILYDSSRLHNASLIPDIWR